MTASKIKPEISPIDEWEPEENTHEICFKDGEKWKHLVVTPIATFLNGIKTQTCSQTVWNKNLTEEEILYLYNKGKVRSYEDFGPELTDGLVSYYDMSEADVTIKDCTFTDQPEASAEKEPTTTNVEKWLNFKEIEDAVHEGMSGRQPAIASAVIEAIKKKWGLPHEWVRRSEVEEAIGQIRQATKHECKQLKADHAAELAELENKLEIAGMQLAGVSTVAYANTPETAKQAREMHPNYKCAAISDVADAVDREMSLRSELASLRREVATHEITACYFPYKNEADLSWRDLDTNKEFHITIRIPPEEGEKLAQTVPACVYLKARTTPKETSKGNNETT